MRVRVLAAVLTVFVGAAFLSAGVSAHDFIDLVTLYEPGLTKEVVWNKSEVGVTFNCDRDGIDTAKEALCWDWPDGAGFKIAFIGSDAAGNRYFYGPAKRPGNGGDWHGVWRERPTFDPDGLGPDGGDELVLDIPRVVNSLTPEGYPHQDSANVMQGWSFDSVNGVLYIALTHGWSTDPGGTTVSGGGRGVIRVSGFATVADIMLSYEPTAGLLSFRTPRYPEGLPAADYFDTYYGDLATVGDWSQAQPLQCGYPATPPQAGDYFEVADTLPAPAPGSGRYYVTAVTHQGTRRFGRQSNGGVLSGRDARTLPPCTN
jgi:hypothetical protein